MISQKAAKRWFRKKLQMPGTQKMRNEAPEGPYSSGTAMTKLKRNPAPSGTNRLFTEPSTYFLEFTAGM
jgi:hypothetical protein